MLAALFPSLLLAITLGTEHQLVPDAAVEHAAIAASTDGRRILVAWLEHDRIRSVTFDPTSSKKRDAVDVAAVKYPQWTEISTAGVDRIAWVEGKRLFAQHGNGAAEEIGINHCASGPEQLANCAPAMAGDDIFWVGERSVRSTRRIITTDPKTWYLGLRVADGRLYWVEEPDPYVIDAPLPLQRIRSSTITGRDVRTIAEKLFYPTHVVVEGGKYYWPEYRVWFGGMAPPEEKPWPSHLIIRTTDRVVRDEEREWKEMEPAADLALFGNTLLWSDEGGIRAMPVSGGTPETVGEATTCSLRVIGTKAGYFLFYARNGGIYFRSLNR
jgi:hypothetical protein